MMCILLISLFMAEGWTLGNAPDSENNVLYGILLAIFIIFIVEVILMSWVQKKYFLSFFFWMDLLGTVSILFDIGWIFSSHVGRGKISVLRTTRIARIGARYQRLTKLWKMLKQSAYACFDKKQQYKSVSYLR